MTLSTSNNTFSYSVTSVPQAFPFPVLFFKNEHLVVTRSRSGAATQLVLGTDYSVAGAGNDSGGTVTVSASIQVGDTLIIQRVVPAVQEIDLRNQGEYLAETVEDGFDYQTMLAQQAKEDFSRAMVRPVGTDYFDAEGYPVKNLGDPVFAQDAATKAWAEAFIASILQTGQGSVNTAANVIFISPAGEIKTVQDMSAPIGASLIGYLTRTVYDQLDDEVNVLSYIPGELHASIRDGSIRDNPVDLAPYIQAALQAARGPGAVTRLRLRGVYCPSGFYPTSTFYVPEGVILRGAGACETTSANATQFIQFGDADVIRFAGHFSGDRYWWFGRLQDFTVYGRRNSSGKQVATAGYGIHFREADGSMVTPHDTTCIRDVIVRFCAQGGVRMPKGGLPLDLSTMKIKDCEGPGVSITGGAGSIQSIILYQPSIDRCGTEAIRIENHDNRGQITIIGAKLEGGTNTNLTVPAVRQAVGIRLVNCDEGAPIQIVGATHIMGAGDSIPPGDFVVVEGGGTPHVEWSGVQIRIADNQAGGTMPMVLSMPSKGVAMPRNIKTGSLSNLETVCRSTLSTRRHVLGNADTYSARSVEGSAYQIAGETPGFSLYESDAAADAKAWLTVASNGSLTMRSVSDSGVATVFMQVQRTGGAATKVEWAVPQKPGNYAKASLPAAASMANCISTVSDPTAGKGRVVYSDGVSWKYVSDDTAV